MCKDMPLQSEQKDCAEPVGYTRTTDYVAASFAPDCQALALCHLAFPFQHEPFRWGCTSAMHNHHVFATVSAQVPFGT